MEKFTTHRTSIVAAQSAAFRQGARGSSIAILLVGLTLAGCGGGGGGGSNPTPSGSGTASGSSPAAAALPLPTAAQASRFLTQATYGPRSQDITALTTQGYNAWIKAQLAVPATSQLAQVEATANPTWQSNRMAAFWKTAVQGPDQLRQRVAFALSEIFVVSDQSTTLNGNADAVAYYWDILANDAFGNFRDLLQDVTLSPPMGLYLNMLGNQKPNSAKNIHADENYAREIMQLMTIGLYQLNPDGTVVTGANGAPVQTYTQAQVTDLARVFTGWSWDSTDFFYGPANNLTPMMAYESEHDTGAKTIVGGVTIPAGGTAESDLKIALDTLFNHPNTGPFISKQLIQRLVTSNPSPAYVSRVAAVFANNGSGVRGDLSAVITAILLDDEARNDTTAAQSGYGKRREPLLTAAQMWRAFDGHDATNNITYGNANYDLHEAPLSSPSVFNFFKPVFSPPGVLQQANLVAPEMQLVTASNLTLQHNFYADNILYRAAADSNTQPTDIVLHLDPWLPLATSSDSTPLIDQLNLVLMSGQMTPAMHSSLVAAINPIDNSDGGVKRVATAAFLVFTSQQYQIQR